MALSKFRSKKKVTGKVYRDIRKKRLTDLARNPTYTKLDNKKTKKVRIKSGKYKTILLTINEVNIYNPKTKKYQKSIIKTVLENPANRHFIRRNILTKGTIIETEIGKAKIVSRPGQEPILNAILV